MYYSGLSKEAGTTGCAETYTGSLPLGLHIQSQTAMKWKPWKSFYLCWTSTDLCFLHYSLNAVKQLLRQPSHCLQLLYVISRWLRARRKMWGGYMQMLRLGSIQFRYPQGFLETAPADASTWLFMRMVVCVTSCVLLYAIGKKILWYVVGTLKNWHLRL